MDNINYEYDIDNIHIECNYMLGKLYGLYRKYFENGTLDEISIYNKSGTVMYII